MKKIKIGKAMIIIGFTIYVIQNTFFGWNETAMSKPEEITDLITQIFFYGGMMIYIMPIWELYESDVKKHNANKKV